jgi:hypothetical protein
MISTYRLGDLLFVGLCDNEQEDLLRDHPDSIGSRYILEKRMDNSISDIDLIIKIVLEHIVKYTDVIPKDITESTLIHVRLGDVVGGTWWHEIEKRPFDVEYLKSILVNDTNKKYVIGKCFFAWRSSTNYEECINLSNIYLQNVINELNAEYFDSGNADIDLCCAVKSKLFIQGRGFFSKLIVEIRKKLNLYSIETEPHAKN